MTTAINAHVNFGRGNQKMMTWKTIWGRTRQFEHLYFSSNSLCETQPAHLVLSVLLQDTMQEVCVHTGCSCKCLQDAAEINMLQKSVCTVSFYLRESAALDDLCVFDPSKDTLQQAVNEAEMSEGGRWRSGAVWQRETLLLTPMLN